MPRLEEVYLSREELPGLTREFYRSYDDDYWHAKIEMYEYLLDNLEDVFSDTESDIGHYQRLLHSEFHHMFYHSTEALIGLVRSLAKNGIPWIDLKENRGHSIDNFVENKLQADGFADEIQDVFYPGAEFTDPADAAAVKDSVNFIHRYLQTVGGMYGNRSVYNEYKHGLRLIVTESKISMDIEKEKEDRDAEVLESDRGEETEDGIQLTMMDDDVMYFLDPVEWGQDEETGKKYWSLARKAKAMEFDLYRRLCSVNSTLIEMIFKIRREQLDIDGEERREVNVTLFSEDDIEDVFEFKNDMISFSANLYYPKSDEDLLIYEIVQ